MMNSQFQVWAMQSKEAIAARERAMILADQEALREDAKKRREHEYRMALLGDISYWGWLVVLVALIAGFGGWWLRGTVAPTSANTSGGTFSTEISDQANKTDGTFPDAVPQSN